MKYDFTSILDRRGKDAAAYDNVGAMSLRPQGQRKALIYPHVGGRYELPCGPHHHRGDYRPGSAPFLRVLLSHRQIL